MAQNVGNGPAKGIIGLLKVFYRGLNFLEVGFGGTKMVMF